MLKRYGFATKPPTLPSGKTCILEMQITDFAFSPEESITRILCSPYRPSRLAMPSCIAEAWGYERYRT
jgi:hypothetical protein